TYLINGVNKSGESMIQSYWSNYCSNAYNFIQDVNWLKLRSINLSYDFSKLINGQNFIKGLTASFTANNLFTWTNYVGGMDPEVAAVGSAGGSGSVGIDYCGVPTQRSYAFGINLTF
ncbi:MAG: SusC/RagA family TonB-linked outer membrane protein, partial [Bacteroidales bacterium]|nr:SusC/RagA family TonB-linked outer membrane protein [Bacteroidales bacterium]